MNRPIHFEIQADDIARAKAFYEKALGWKIEKWMSPEGSADKEASEQTMQGEMNYWGLLTGDGPGINGGMYQRPDKQEDRYYMYDCTLGVEDIDKAIESIKANGGTITREKMEMKGVGWFASAKDTEGNRFGLMQASPDMKPMG